MKTALRLYAGLLLSLLMLGSCQSEKSPSIKYAFLFIGDGMGQAEVNTAQAYQAVINDQQGFLPLTFTQFPANGWASTWANNRLITCSAAAGTALATGHKTNIDRISMDPDGKNDFMTIAEKAKKDGLKVGIITSVSIDHATPAVFYAHQPNRGQYFDIGMDLAHSEMDFFGGGGFKKPVKVINGDTLSVLNAAMDNHFNIVNSLEGFEALTPGSGKVIAIAPHLADGAALPYVIDNVQGNPTLADFTEKAIELLKDSKGFFIMVEGGKIDWAGHGNDGATNLHEVLAFDDAIAVAKKFYDAHPEETLIVVTADHETGGLAMGNKEMKYESDLKVLHHQKLSSDEFTTKVKAFRKTLTTDHAKDFIRMLDLINESFGLGDTTPLSEKEKEHLKELFNGSMYQYSNESVDITYSSYEPITAYLIELMSQKAGLGWTTYSHTAINVPVWAIGPGSKQFDGIIDNTDIPKFMEKVLLSGSR